MSDVIAQAGQITAILRRYRVNLHWKASAGPGPRRYAVWDDRGQQVTEPTSHAEAQQCREGLIVADLLELIEAQP